MLYAIGKPGQPVRLIISVENDDAARALRQSGEQAHTLNRLPTVPIMITSDDTDVVPIPLTLTQVQAARWADAKAYRKIREAAGCSTSKGVIQTDAESKANINAAASDALRWKISNVSTNTAGVAVAAGAPWSRVWTMFDNSNSTMTADDMISAADAVSNYLDSVHQASRAIRVAIFAATTVVAVEAVDITLGYPAK